MNNDEIPSYQTNQRKMNWPSEVARLTSIRGSPTSLRCIERDQALAIMGYSSEEIKAMCKPEDSIEKILDDVRIYNEEEQRKLKRENRNRRKQHQPNDKWQNMDGITILKE